MLFQASNLPVLVLIARNEQRCIERCLRSARPWTSRMLVLDTGSVDGTPDLARACGAEVHFFEWVDDFSAARNHALQLADADWNLVLDADEWIESNSTPPDPALLRQPGIGLVHLLSIEQSSGMDLPVASWMPRLLPRGVRYQGRIHEQPVAQLPRFRTGWTLGHDGYMKAQLQHKKGRNRRLLEQALQESPEDPYLGYQLARELEGSGEFSAACDHYLQALARLPAGAAYEHSLLVQLIHSLGRSGRIDEALAQIDQNAQRFGNSPDFHFAAGNVYLDKGMQDPAEALSCWLPRAEQAWKHCLAIGDQPELEGSVAGRGSFLAAFNLHVVFDVLGDRPRSQAYKALAEQLKSDHLSRAAVTLR